MMHVTLQEHTADGKRLGPCRFFPVHAWVRGPPESPENPVVLREGERLVGDAPWMMEVQTGSMRGAGTDANVFFSVEYLAQVRACCLP